MDICFQCHRYNPITANSHHPYPWKLGMRPFAPKNTTVFCHGWATKAKFWKCRPSKINESNCIWVICSILFDECTHQGKRDIDLRRWRQYCTLPADIKIGKAICLDLLICLWLMVGGSCSSNSFLFFSLQIYQHTMAQPYQGFWWPMGQPMVRGVSGGY